MKTRTIDVGPARLGGALRGSRARVVWHEGVLYVIDQAGTTKTYDAPTAPQQRNSGFTVEVDGKPASFYRSGCACSYPQGKIALATILGVTL